MNRVALLILIVAGLSALPLPHGGQAVSADPLSDAVGVSAGYDHTCAVTSTGGVKCWGGNYQGQLGDGRVCLTPCTTPVSVSGFASGAAATAVGEFRTCALTTEGGVQCWGYFVLGALVDTPLAVPGLASGVAAVAVGGSHACVTISNGAKCWGYNTYGQLGDGTTTDRLTPADVSGLTSGVAAIATGNVHTCALTNAGVVKCWGDNTVGELGDGTATSHNTPVDVSGLTGGVAAVSASSGGAFTCALTLAGGVKCWGLNESGELGDGTTTQRRTPADVSGLTTGVSAISAGGEHTCALTTAGGVKCWGRNEHGQLGDGTSTGPQMCLGKSNPCSTIPVDVVGLGPVLTSTPTPRDTPTNSPTATHTPTATDSIAPPTPTRTPTATPTPAGLVGDVNKDGIVNPIDAQLVLQYSAGLISSINPNADANRDGTANSIDAALILQYTAGLLAHWPP